VISSPGIIAGTKTDQAGDDVAEYISNGAVKSVFFRIGTGATATHGGSLAAGQTYQVQFQVTVNDPGYGNPVPSIMNIARITSTSDAGVNFVDDGTAIINPEAGPMPVTLTRFTATLMQNNQVQVYWSTSMEINCKQFIVQRSYDSKIFTDQETVAGNETTNLAHSYSVNDNVSSFTGSTIYYRLKQIDIDGKENLSKIIPVKLQKNNASAIVSPNPFIDFININLQWDATEMVSAKIFSVQGTEILSKQILVNKGNNNIKISDLSNLPSGNYILEIFSSSQKIIQKIVK
jgi:hypothetical protein